MSARLSALLLAALLGSPLAHPLQSTAARSGPQSGCLAWRRLAAALFSRNAARESATVQAPSEQADGEGRMEKDDRHRVATARKQRRTCLREQRRQWRQTTKLISEAALDGARVPETHPSPPRCPEKHWHMVSFYRLENPDSPHTLAERLRIKWVPLGIVGRVYVANEGINAQLAVPDVAVEEFQQTLRREPFLEGVFLNFDVPVPSVGGVVTGGGEEGAGGMGVGEDGGGGRGVGVGGGSGGGSPKGRDARAAAPFAKLSIKLRPHVLADGFLPPSPTLKALSRDTAAAARGGEGNVSGSAGAQTLDWTNNGRKISPQLFHQKLSELVRAGKGGMGPTDGRPLVLDIRNKYETDVGTFDAAVPLGTDTFRESWQALDALLEGVSRDQEILTYCTGGIRCEKANAYIVQRLGFRPERVYALEGGIVHYSKFLRDRNESSTSLFYGVNHVFDQRNGGQVGAQRIAPQVLGRCHVCCSSSDDQKDCAYKHCPRPFYKRRFILCTSCSLRLGACCRYIFSRVLSIVTLYSKYTKALRERERERESFVRNYP
jgi:predicted sulfurtransferase